jgi:hypothetical protein
MGFCWFIFFLKVMIKKDTLLLRIFDRILRGLITGPFEYRKKRLDSLFVDHERITCLNYTCIPNR